MATSDEAGLRLIAWHPQQATSQQQSSNAEHDPLIENQKSWLIEPTPKLTNILLIGVSLSEATRA